MVTMQNPYVGPRTIFTGELLYGRQNELRQLREQLLVDRIVVLHAPSGAGKSSLINAGLISLIGLAALLGISLVVNIILIILLARAGRG